MKRAVPLMFAWVCLVLVTAAPAPAWAQEVTVGRRAVAEAEVNLRDSIPIGLFAESQVVDVIREGEIVAVLEQREITTFAGTKRWLRVQKRGATTSGWAFNGDAGTPSYFRAVD
jgi:hypothetical protein